MKFRSSWPNRPATPVAELRRFVARAGVPPGRPRRGVAVRPRGARPRHELHRHLAVLRPRPERVPARHRPARRAAGQLSTWARSSAATPRRTSTSRPGASSRASTSACSGWASITSTSCSATTSSSWTWRRSSTRRCRPCAGSRQQGKVRFVGVSGYPMKIFRYVLDRADARRDPVVQPLHAAEHDARRPGALPEGQGRRHHERRAVLGPAADERAAAPLAQGDAGGARDLPAGGRALRSPRRGHRASLPCSSRWPTRTWRPASSARRTRRTSATGCDWAERADRPGLLGEVLAILRPIQTGSTSKGGRRTTTSPPHLEVSESMKALLLEAPRTSGSASRRADPPQPGPGEALVRVHRVGICGTDISGYLGKMPFFSYPRIPGHELGVEVLEVGEGVDQRQARRPLRRRAVHQLPEVLRLPRAATPTAARSTRRSASTATAGCGRGSSCRPASCTSRASSAFEQLALVETLAIGCHAVEPRRPCKPTSRA